MTWPWLNPMPIALHLSRAWSRSGSALGSTKRVRWRDRRPHPGRSSRPPTPLLHPRAKGTKSRIRRPRGWPRVCGRGPHTPTRLPTPGGLRGDISGAARDDPAPRASPWQDPVAGSGGGIRWRDPVAGSGGGVRAQAASPSPALRPSRRTLAPWQPAARGWAARNAAGLRSTMFLSSGPSSDPNGSSSRSSRMPTVPGPNRLTGPHAPARGRRPLSARLDRAPIGR